MLFFLIFHNMFQPWSLSVASSAPGKDTKAIKCLGLGSCLGLSEEAMKGDMLLSMFLAYTTGLKFP